MANVFNMFETIFKISILSYRMRCIYIYIYYIIYIYILYCIYTKYTNIIKYIQHRFLQYILNYST